MQTFYLSYKVMQTLLMTAVLLSLIVTLFLLLMFYDMRIDKKKWHWNILAFLFLFFLLNHLAYSFGQIDKGENYYEVLPVPIWVIWCIVSIIDFLLIWEGIRLRRITKEQVGRNSIQEAMNLLPIGICYFNSNGAVKLANTQMYRLFRVLAHRDLQKLSELRDALHTSTQNGVTRLTDKKEMYLFPDGKAWDYQENEVKDSDGNVYTEAVFMDITKQYHEKINLTKQTEKLKEISKELRYLCGPECRPSVPRRKTAGSIRWAVPAAVHGVYVPSELISFISSIKGRSRLCSASTRPRSVHFSSGETASGIRVKNVSKF